MKKGLTLIEVVVSIFLIAAVIATGLLILSGNLNVIKKANELTIATALLQYTIEEVKNIDFPPVYYDTQYKFGDRIAKSNPSPPPSVIYKQPEEIDLQTDGNDWTPSYYANDFIVKRFDFRYDFNGNFLFDPTNPDTDLTALHRIDIYVLRRRGNKVLLKHTIYRTRDGMY